MGHDSLLFSYDSRCKGCSALGPETAHYHALITCISFSLSSSISLPHVLFDCLCFMLPFLDSSFLYLNYLLWFEYRVPKSPPIFPQIAWLSQSRHKSSTWRTSLTNPNILVFCSLLAFIFPWLLASPLLLPDLSTALCHMILTHALLSTYNVYSFYRESFWHPLLYMTQYYYLWVLMTHFFTRWWLILG